MTDQEALKILSTKGIKDIDKFCKAIAVASNRLQECQWMDYNPETFNEEYKVTFGMRIILGLCYDDGSRGTAEGIVLYDTERGYYIDVSPVDRCDLTANATIEKWMKYPKYAV